MSPKPKSPTPQRLLGWSTQFMFVAISASITGCEGNQDAGPTDFVLHGVSQKGPFINGSSVLVQGLSDELTPINEVYNTQIADDSGAFTLNVTLTAPYVEVVVDGYYFDEIANRLSSSTLTLRSVAAAQDATPTNVNILSTLEKGRLLQLIESGQTYDAAKLSAQNTVLAAFGIESSLTPQSSESLDITQPGQANAALMAVSAVLLCSASLQADVPTEATAILSELIRAIELDLAVDGELDDGRIKTLFSRCNRYMDLDAIRENVEERLAEVGSTATLPPFEDFIDSDGDGILNRDDADGQFRFSDSAGSLSRARVQAAAVRLLNGKCLITGGHGRDEFGVVSTASSTEIYDPETESFSPAGEMDRPRSQHTATALSDGRILIVGGGTTVGPTETAELADPDGAVFVPTGSLDFPRQEHTATLLPNDRVVIIGGSFADDPSTLPPAEVWEPSTSMFTQIPVSRFAFRHQSTLLADGRVLVTGGWTSSINGKHARSAWLLDVDSSTVSDAGQMVHPRSEHAAVRLPDGRVLVVGGEQQVPFVEPQVTAEIFDPLTETFTLTDAPKLSRQFPVLVSFGTGKVLVLGGVETTGTTGTLRETEVFDSATGLFSRGASLSDVRWGMAIAVHDLHRFVVFGGQGSGSSAETADYPLRAEIFSQSEL